MKPVIDSLARRSRPDRKGETRDLSTAGQHAVNVQRIAEYGGVLGEKWTEPGKSAWKPGVKRPQMDAAFARLASGASQGICIYDIDRMLRRVADALRIVEIAEKGFVILDADGEYDLMTPNGREQFYNRAVAAESFSFKLSKKIQRGFNTKAALGEGKPGRFRGLGFHADATTVREDQRETIRRAARKVLETRRWTPGCKILNDAGILTAAGNPWVPDSLRNAMTRPAMAGHIRSGGVIKGRFAGEPILDEADWQELIRMVRTRGQGRQPSGAFMCSHSAVRCGNCGNHLTGFYPQGGNPKYICKRRGVVGCGKTIGHRDAVDAIVGELVVSRLSDPRHARQISEMAQRRAAQLQPHEKELGRLIGLRSYWDGQLNDGQCDQVRHGQMTAAVNAKIVTEEAKIRKIGSEPAQMPAQESTEKATRTWLKYENKPEERRHLIDAAFQGYGLFITPGPVTDRDFSGRVRVTRLEE